MMVGLKPQERYTIVVFATTAAIFILVAILSIVIAGDWFGGIFSAASAATLGWIAWAYAMKCIRDEVPG